MCSIHIFNVKFSENKLQLVRLLLVLEVKQLIVDLLNVHLRPENVKVAINAVHDSVVETIELLKKVQLLLDASNILVLCDWHSKQFLPSAVGLVLTPQLIKTSLHAVKKVKNSRIVHMLTYAQAKHIHCCMEIAQVFVAGPVCI